MSTYQAYLAAGDGPVADAVDMMGGAITITKIDFGRPQPGDSQREIVATLDIEGDDQDSLVDNLRAIQQKLRDAREAAGPDGIGTPVTLSVLLNTSEWVYFDLFDGDLYVSDESLATYDVGWLQGVELALKAALRGRGEPIAIGQSSTLTVGDGAYQYVASVLGDDLASTRVRVRDKSTSTTILNRVYLGRVSKRGMLATDYDHVIDVTPSGAGTSFVDTGAIGGACARITTSPDWQEVARFSKPSAAPLTEGLLDLMLRVRDASPTMGTPTGLDGILGMALVQSGRSIGGNQAPIFWTQPTTEGALLLLTIGYSGGTPTAPKGAWQLAYTVSNSTGNIDHYFWPNAPTQSTDGYTIYKSDISTMAVEIAEYSGFSGAVNVLDKTSTGTGSTSLAATGSTGTLSQANELAYAAESSGTAIANSWSNGFSKHISAIGLGAAERIVASTASLSTNASLSSAGAWAAGIATYKALAPGGSVPADIYEIRVAAVDAAGNVGLASDPMSVTVPVPTSILLSWVAPATGNAVDHYRVYYQSQTTGTWKYVNTSTNATSYSFTSETGATTATPLIGSTAQTQVRVKVGLKSGTTLIPTTATITQVAGGNWETLPIVTGQLPDVPAQDGGSRRDWLVVVEARNPVRAVTLDVDVGLLFRNLVIATYYDSSGTAMNLATKRDWLFDLRHRDGRMSCVLLDQSTGAEAGRATIERGAGFALAPGESLVLLWADGAGGVNDVVNGKLSIEFERITPSYAMLAGGGL